MHPLLVVGIGVTTVIFGVLLLRLHAFLALILAALIVGLLTPQNAVRDSQLQKNSVPVRQVVAEDRSQVVLAIKSEKKWPKSHHRYLVYKTGIAPDPTSSSEFHVAPRSDWQTDYAGRVWPTLNASANEAAIDPAGDYMAIRPEQWDGANSIAKQTVGERIAAAFGSTCAKIGILIALAAIIGKCLLDSGAADRIVRSALSLVGERGAPVAFTTSSFLLGIPVFFDTVFYLMIPLGKALRMRTGHNYVLYVLSIIVGGTMAHSLVPPTPGPLLVAGELGVDVGMMILGGCVVCMFTSVVGIGYAHFMNARHELPLRESSDFSLAEVEAIAARDTADLPPLWLSLLPIILPVVLISGLTTVNTFDWVDKGTTFYAVLKTLGNKNLALMLATAIGLLTLVRQQRSSLRELASSIQDALASGGVIILITAAGGAFGAMLQQTGIAGLIRDLPTMSTTVVLTIAFLITTAIRSAQGSSTVAMITAVGVLVSFANPEVLGCHPLYLALAIGCGSKPVSWMNDSGFWVMCKMSGMTEAEGLRFITPMSILMGVTGLVVTLAGAALFPLL